MLNFKAKNQNIRYFVLLLFNFSTNFLVAITLVTSYQMISKKPALKIPTNINESLTD